MMGGLIMAHGDDRGPPRAAAGRVVPGRGHGRASDDDAGSVADASAPARRRHASTAEGLRVRLDAQVTNVAFGRRATDWEIKGVPVRVELGPRDVAEDAWRPSLARSRHRRQASGADVAAARGSDA
jgi:prolyl-tRNA synthetase